MQTKSESKVKVAIWGITDMIWCSIKSNLDFRELQLECFIDNNDYTNGMKYEGIRIHKYNNDIREIIDKVDYILIAAYSGYQAICNTLINDGICINKIQLYITKDLKSYSIGQIYNIDYNLIDRIYINPMQRKNDVQKYIEVEKDYQLGKPIEENEMRWYDLGSFVAHACGGIVNGRKLNYTNSKEALIYTLENTGLNLIECDICGIKKDEVLLACDYSHIHEAECEHYTLQSIDDILNKIIQYPNVRILFDVKWNHIEEYIFYVDKIKQIIDKYESGGVRNLLQKQVVMEVYDEESIIYAQHAGFECFYTQYRNPDLYNYMQIALTCIKYNVGAVGYRYKDIINNVNKDFLSIFKQKNIKVFAYSCNTLSEYRLGKEKGLDGVFTDYLNM